MHRGAHQATSRRHTCLPVRSGSVRSLSRLCKQDATKRSIQANSLKKLAVFVSGGGSNLRQIHKACETGQIKGEIVVCYIAPASCLEQAWIVLPLRSSVLVDTIHLNNFLGVSTFHGWGTHSHELQKQTSFSCDTLLESSLYLSGVCIFGSM